MALSPRAFWPEEMAGNRNMAKYQRNVRRPIKAGSRVIAQNVGGGGRLLAKASDIREMRSLAAHALYERR
jgi:hypothetical protein